MKNFVFLDSRSKPNVLSPFGFVLMNPP
jgi:hypothetical protein